MLKIVMVDTADRDGNDADEDDEGTEVGNMSAEELLLQFCP